MYAVKIQTRPHRHEKAEGSFIFFVEHKLSDATGKGNIRPLGSTNLTTKFFRFAVIYRKTIVGAISSKKEFA